MATMHRRTWTLDVEQDWIDATCERDTLDPKWRGSDSSGHEHFYDHGYPTLDYIIDSSHWCDGTEGWALHDPHEYVDASHYECKICREVVEPGVIPGGTPQYVAGMRHATLRGIRSDGAEIVASLTSDEAQTLAASDDTAAQVVIDAIPQERIMSMTFSSR